MFFLCLLAWCLKSHLVLPCTNRHQNKRFKWALSRLCLCFGAFRRKLYFLVQTGTRTNLFNGGLVVYVYGLGALSLILHFRVQTGTKTTLFNGGLVVYAFDFGAFSRFLYFRIQIGTKTNLLNGGLVAYVHELGVLIASCTSVYK